LNPPDVRDASLICDPAAFGEHGWVRVEADCFLKQVGESDGEDARAAPNIEQAPAPIETFFIGENRLKLGRVGRSTVPVMNRRTLVGRWVVRHNHRMPTVACASLLFA
jgi:hypothetical protein